MAKRNRVIGTTPDIIVAVEQRLGRALPPSFTACLLDHNGSGDLFPVPDEREPRTLTGNIFDEHDQLREYMADCLDAEPASVAHLLPVAAVGDGDKWCLDLDVRDDDDEAPVVRWSHETGETWTVATDFAAFVAARDAGELDD